MARMSRLALMLCIALAFGVAFSSDSATQRASAEDTVAPAFAAHWVAGDLHTHTFITDGNTSHADVVHHALRDFGLDFVANSEHGGTTTRDAANHSLGTTIWRWQSLERHSYPEVARLRGQYPDKMVLQGLEWNVPGGDHASVGIVADEPSALSEFEYRFDRKDLDTSRVALAKDNHAHSDAVLAVKWLAAHYPDTSYVVLNHPNRLLGSPVERIRSLNDAAPDVMIGLEGVVGRQRKAARGGYYHLFGSQTYKARLYGGADYTVARVGGVWDSLLGEGRRLWIFGNSDFHGSSTDFWPGEYTKTFTRVAEPGYAGLVAGMRSGNSFTVTGGLVDSMKVTLTSAESSATLGETLTARAGEEITVTVRFRVPQHTSGGRHPSLHHLDLIAGDVHEKATFGEPGYSSTSNSTTRVVGRFTRSTPWRGWRTTGTWYQVSRKMRVSHDGYVRIRGTNLAPSTRGQTDRAGNPLMDPVDKNTTAIAWSDCWLYTNPVFIDVE